MKSKKLASPPTPEFLIDMIGSHFLEAANHLREIQDLTPDQFVPTVRQLGIGLRKAYALAQIDRVFHDRGIDRDRLRKIGWTKLAMLAAYIDDDNIEAMLDMAEELPSHMLRLVVRGEEVDSHARIVALLLNAEQMALFERVMEHFGAMKVPRGWLWKERALVKAMQQVLPSAA